MTGEPADPLSDTQRSFIDRFVVALAPVPPPAPPVEAAAPAESGPAGDGGAFAARWAAARKGWQTASDSVDGQISSLQAALRGSDDAELQQIGNFGLNAFTGDKRVSVMAAVREIDTAAGHPVSQQIDRAKSSIAAYRAHLASDARIRACDTNPFGVTVSIEATLDPALGALLAAIESAPAT